MKKIKVIFPDGSIGEVDEKDLSSALAAGAKRYTGKPAKMVAVTFADGSTGEVDDDDYTKGVASGSLKKKEGTGSEISSRTLPATGGTQPLSTQQEQSKLGSIIEERSNKSFLDRDIDSKYDFSLSNPALFQPANKFSLKNIYYEQAQQKFDAEKEFHRQEVKSSPEKLAAYNQNRLSEINKSIDEAKKERGKKYHGGLTPETRKEINQLDADIAEMEVYKAKLKSSLVPEAAKFIVADAIKNPDSFNAEEVGRRILAVADPDYSWLVKKSEQNLLVDDNTGYKTDESGLSIPTAEAAGGVMKREEDKRPIYRSYMERVGLDVAKQYIEALPDSEEKTKILNSINSSEEDYDFRNAEQTAQRVRDKLGVIFYKQGKSGWLGYATKNIEKELNDPDNGFTEAERKVGLEYVLPQEYSMGVFRTNIPGSGLLRSGFEGFEKTILSAPKSIGGLLGLRNESDLATEILNSDSDESRYKKPGQSSSLIGSINFLNNKEISEGLTEEEKKLKTQLEKDINVRSNWSKWMDGMGDLTGQVVGIALMSRGIGGAGKSLLAEAEGLPAMLSNRTLLTNAAGQILSNETVGLTITGYLNSYDNYRKQALQLMPGDDNAGARVGYANTMAVVEGLSERIFNDVKVLKAFSGELSPTVADITKRFLNKEITQGVAREELQSAVKKYLKPFGKEFFKSEFQESTEEAVVDLADGISQTVFGGSEFDVAKIGKQALNTFITTAISSPLVSGMAAQGASKQSASERAFMKSAIFNMAINPNEYLQTIEKLRASEDISQEEANEKIKLVNSANKYLKELPVDIKQMDHAEAATYLLHRMNEGILSQQIDETKDEVLKSEYQKQIKRSQEIRKGLLGGDIGVTPDLVEVTSDDKKAKDLGIEDVNNLQNEDLIGTSFKKENEFAAQPQSLFERAKAVGSNAVDLLAGEKESEEGMKALTEQAADAPASMLESLKGDRGLTTDLIAQNDEQAINDSIQKQEDRLVSMDDNLSPEDQKKIVDDVDASTSLLREGLAKKSKQEQQITREPPSTTTPSISEQGKQTSNENITQATTADQQGSVQTNETGQSGQELGEIIQAPAAQSQQGAVSSGVAVVQPSANEATQTRRGVSVVPPASTATEEEVAKPEEKRTETEFSKKARSIAATIREKGLREALPNWAKADLPEGTQQQGFGGKALDEAIARAIELVADAVDAGSELADAISSGFQHLKNYYSNNAKSFDEEKVRKEFTKNVNNIFGLNDTGKPRPRIVPVGYTADEDGNRIAPEGNFFDNKSISLSGERAEYLSKPTIEGSGKNITQPFDYDKTELDLLLEDGRRWIAEAKLTFNDSPVHYAVKLLSDLKSFKGSTAVKGVAMANLLNSIDTDLKYKLLSAGQRDILIATREQLERTIAENAREGSLTLNAQRLIYKLYHGEYKLGDELAKMVTSNVQDKANKVTEALRQKKSGVSDAARNQHRKNKDKIPTTEKPKKESKRKASKGKYESAAKKLIADNVKKLKDEIIDLANKIKC